MRIKTETSVRVYGVGVFWDALVKSLVVVFWGRSVVFDFGKLRPPSLKVSDDPSAHYQVKKKL